MNSKAAPALSLFALPDVPLISPGDDLPKIFFECAEKTGISLRDGSLVVAQKVISKAEGRLVALADVEPRPEAIEIAERDEKDPRHIEVVLRESAKVVRHGNRVLISETRHGFVCANAGVDLSNAPGEDVAVLLPVDPDGSARALMEGIEALGGGPLAVVITDTFGRPWREGLVDVAIGSAGIAPVDDLRGQADLAGRELVVTTAATVDQLAAAAGILMRKDYGIPAVWVEGVPIEGDGRVVDMLRDPSEDLFR